MSTSYPESQPNIPTKQTPDPQNTIKIHKFTLQYLQDGMLKTLIIYDISKKYERILERKQLDTSGPLNTEGSFMSFQIYNEGVDPA